VPAARGRGHVSSRLSDAKRPNSYLAWSEPERRSLAVEDRTFICSQDEEDAGPTNNWRDPAEMRGTMNDLFSGSMRRTHHVRRAVLDGAPLGSDKSHVGVEITDSPYVVVSMRIMTRMGTGALDVPRRGGRVRPRASTRSARRWPTARRTCRGRRTPRVKYIVHYPREP